MRYTNNDEKPDFTKLPDIMQTISRSIDKFIAPLRDGERITLKELTERVQEDTKLKVSTVHSLVSTIARTKEGFYLRQGAGGGLFKGERKTHIDPRMRCDSCGQVIRERKSSPKIENVEVSELIEEIIAEDDLD